MLLFGVVYPIIYRVSKIYIQNCWVFLAGFPNPTTMEAIQVLSDDSAHEVRLLFFGGGEPSRKKYRGKTRTDLLLSWVDLSIYTYIYIYTLFYTFHTAVRWWYVYCIHTYMYAHSISVIYLFILHLHTPLQIYINKKSTSSSLCRSLERPSLSFRCRFVGSVILRETSSKRPWKSPKARIIFQPSIFRGENVSFREGVILWKGISPYFQEI